MKKYLSLFILTAVFASAQSYDIAFITSSNRSENYWKAVYSGAIKAQQELQAQGIKMNIIWNATSSADHVKEQQELMTQVTARHVKGIVLAPANAQALAAPVEAASQAGIPTVVIDAALHPPVHVSYINSDNFTGGLTAARRLGALLNGQGKVAVLRAQEGKPNIATREKGFLNGMKNQFPNIKVLSTDRHAGDNLSDAEKSASELLKEVGKDINGIFTPDYFSSVGMLQALRAAGLGGGKLKFVAFGTAREEIEGVRSGDIQSLVVQNPMEIGYLSITTLAAYFRNKPVEKEIETSCMIITSENLNLPTVGAIIKAITGTAPAAGNEKK